MSTREYDFNYSNDEWHFAFGHISASLILHLECWSDGQIHVQCAERVDNGHVIKGWLDDAIREWVQAHQHTLATRCFDDIEENMDVFAERVDYEMDRAR